ncbi:SIMPL domain-containing protein [uncultured Aquimarina sp.]|uniref:SIMPL domain-containing protein n=1 Tax=uncultured Aquimarina sp. TaxID=575652 RepID=UPI0026070E88|nr:SIMPL domain-containing protein [uncultured Aquimarina sp.]
MKNIVNIIVFITMSNYGIAQLENIPLITVVGKGVVKVKPDYVVLGIKVNKEIRLNSQGNSNVFGIFKDEDTKIKLFDFNNKDISESLIQVKESVYIKEIFVTINELSRLDRYLFELHKLGYKDYIYFDYRVKSLSDHKSQARKKAISSAKKKAALLAIELGQSIGKAHSIQELDSEDYNWYAINDNTNRENITFKLGVDEYVIEPGFLVIISKIQISFDLKK